MFVSPFGVSGVAWMIVVQGRGLPAAAGQVRCGLSCRAHLVVIIVAAAVRQIAGNAPLAQALVMDS
jgi:hypothetical protein